MGMKIYLQHYSFVVAGLAKKLSLGKKSLKRKLCSNIVTVDVLF